MWAWLRLKISGIAFDQAWPDRSFPDPLRSTKSKQGMRGSGSEKGHIFYVRNSHSKAIIHARNNRRHCGRSCQCPWLQGPSRFYVSKKGQTSGHRSLQVFLFTDLTTFSAVEGSVSSRVSILNARKSRRRPSFGIGSVFSAATRCLIVPAEIAPVV